jgi:hypothetical protein
LDYAVLFTMFLDGARPPFCTSAILVEAPSAASWTAASPSEARPLVADEPDALPHNAFVVRGTQQIITAFNSGTTDTVSVGVTATNANELVAAQSVHGAAGVSALTLAATGAGTQAAGNGVTQTGSSGGFDIWVKHAQTGTAPSAGQVVIVLEYFAPNDGDCGPVPNGTTAPAC